ncbi:tyrosine-type recombinase/integrase [Methylomonas sp. MgM2]
MQNRPQKRQSQRRQAFKLFDEKGLFLLVKPTSSGWGKWWRFKYRFDGKEKLLSIGTYPEVGLAQAREKRDEARKLVAAMIDPGENRKAVKEARAESTANSFEVIAREWRHKKVETWGNKNNRPKRMLERNVFPWLGNKPIADILPKDILACLRRVEDRGTIETAHRTLQICGQVFRYAVATARVDRDITQDLKGALPPAKAEHFAAITELNEVAELLRAIDSYQGSSVCALKLAPLVFVRPGELRPMQWQDINQETAEWRYLVLNCVIKR